MREDTVSKQKIPVFAKVPIHNDSYNTFLWEACVQILVRNTLDKHGFPNGAPKVMDIFYLKDGRIGFTMEIILGSETLDRKLKKVNCNEFSQIVTEGIIQISSMISILERELGFNHRDLKSANLLCREIVQSNRKIKKMTVWDENDTAAKSSFRRYEIIVQPRFEYTLIDFGFVCFGKCFKCFNYSFNLSSKLYSLDDICPKPGRDMFMFLAFLLAEFDQKIEQPLRKYFKKWLKNGYNIELPLYVAKPGKGLYTFIRRVGTESDRWIYFISKHPKIISIPDTNAIKLLNDLQSN